MTGKPHIIQKFWSPRSDQNDHVAGKRAEKEWRVCFTHCSTCTVRGLNAAFIRMATTAGWTPASMLSSDGMQ
eukprot:6380521-Amphidinium_carterae.1